MLPAPGLSGVLSVDRPAGPLSFHHDSGVDVIVLRQVAVHPRPDPFQRCADAVHPRHFTVLHSICPAVAADIHLVLDGSCHSLGLSLNGRLKGYRIRRRPVHRVIVRHPGGPALSQEFHGKDRVHFQVFFCLLLVGKLGRPSREQQRHKKSEDQDSCQLPLSRLSSFPTSVGAVNPAARLCRSVLPLLRSSAGSPRLSGSFVLIPGAHNTPS